MPGRLDQHQAYKELGAKIWARMGSLRSEMLRLLKEDEEFRYAVAGLIGLEEILKRLDRHEAQLVKLREDMNRLREDMNKGFELLRRHIDALGARWGLLAEESFRAGMVGVVERFFGGRVERWTYYDEEGFVFGFPSLIEVDMVISDKEHILVEIKSSVSRADVYEFWKVGQLYERIKGVKPRLAIVSPFVREEAKKLAKELGIDVYTSL